MMENEVNIPDTIENALKDWCYWGWKRGRDKYWEYNNGPMRELETGKICVLEP